MRSIVNRCWIAVLGGSMAFSVAGAAARPNTLTQKEEAEGWKLLFHGNSLDGWDPRSTSSPGATGDWTVADGAITCPGTSAGWLSSRDTFSNFELKLEFRGSEKVNSGVFLRSSKEGAPHKTGYELQIWDYQPAGYNTGSLVGSLRAAPVKILGDQWNRYDITADGDHYVIVLNGKKILDDHDSKHSEGVIGFQCQKDNRIEFRDIRIRPLGK
ncbi:MAG TPA: DUF1080 domain-containing protein [Acidobacteriaceae bacterium]|nr:DUF1080 domain-containing protein [Acidobacteriaceae bacterium]